MPRKLTDAYFDNQIEKSRIKSKLTESIPEGVTYFNLVLALTELLQEWSALAFEEEVMTYHKGGSMK